MVRSLARRGTLFWPPNASLPHRLREPIRRHHGDHRWSKHGPLNEVFVIRVAPLQRVIQRRRKRLQIFWL